MTGKELRASREKAGISRATLAQLIGKKGNNIQYWENRNSILPLEMTQKVSKVLNSASPQVSQSSHTSSARISNTVARFAYLTRALDAYNELQEADKFYFHSLIVSELTAGIVSDPTTYQYTTRNPNHEIRTDKRTGPSSFSCSVRN